MIASLPATSPADTATATRRPLWREPVVAWAVIGLLFLLGMVWVMGRWALNGGIHPVDTGPYTISTTSRAILWGWQAFIIVGLLTCSVYCVRQCRRHKKVTFDAALFLGCLTMAWLFPVAVYRVQFYTVNKAVINVSTWGPYIPGWHSPHPEHQLIGVFSTDLFSFWLFMVWFWVGRWLLDRLCNPRRTWSRLTLIAACAIASLVTELVIETLWLLTGSYTYVARDIPGGSFYAGHSFQLPFLEVFVVAVWPFIVVLMDRFARDRGIEAVVLRGSERLPARAAPWLRLLAASGLSSVSTLSYAITVATLFGTHLNLYLPSLRPFGS